MKKGYREGSRRGKALEYLLRKGIDCIKIGSEGPLKHLYFPINGRDDENFIKRIWEAGWIQTSGYMQIEPSAMFGESIMELNPELRLEKDKSYDVLRIKYC